MVTLDLLLEAVRLKALPRAGWVRKGVPTPETVASHSWGVAWLVLALLPPELDRGRALAYATLHDLPEVRVGDITPVDGVSAEDKSQREHAAMRALGTSAPHVVALWEAYEAQQDPEARFVRELDRLDMALQALTHHRAGQEGMAEFVASARAFIQHPALVPVVEAVHAELTSEPARR
ncbi:MAG: HD domain-containing protein [Deltaproteobacteria bacterium]|nr:HD domain-containing protein [Deltaproteobacteria bacterium]